MEKFSDEVTKKVEALCAKCDAARADTSLNADQTKKAVEKIEQEIHTIRGGRVAHHQGRGVMIAIPKG